MAKLNEVWVGQVWTAKISGKLVTVEVREKFKDSLTNRTKFRLYNRMTKRMCEGTAGRLRRRVIERI